MKNLLEAGEQEQEQKQKQKQKKLKDKHVFYQLLVTTNNTFDTIS
jgi:hypothetical protein